MAAERPGTAWWRQLQITTQHGWKAFIAGTLWVPWLLMVTVLGLKDYFDGTHWHNWPEQGPLYAITCVLGLWDLVVLFSARRASSTVVVPTALVLSVLLCVALHLLFGVIWSVQWITDPNRLGDNDWGATVVMSKAISHWFTLTFGATFLHAHVTRSPEPAGPTRDGADGEQIP